MSNLQTTPSTKPTTFVYASDLGLELNCDLMTGLNKTTGQPAADDAPAINAWLAGASASNPLCLLLDGSACVSGVLGPAGGHWSIKGFGHDTGFYVKSGSNAHAISNIPSSTPCDFQNTVAPARGACVSVKDLFINGNRGDGHSGNSTSGDPRGVGGAYNVRPWYFGINLVSLDYISIEGVRCYNIASYNIMLSNCGFWTVDRCHLSNILPTETVQPLNGDGVHVDGPSNDGRISNCYFRTTDDAIALNAPEGYGGTITRIAVSNCVSKDSLTMMRLYSNSAAAGVNGPVYVDEVSVSNYTGSVSVVGFIFGVEGARSLVLTDAVRNVSFTNCKVAGGAFAWIEDNVGTVSFTDCEWNSGGTRGQGMITANTVASTVNSLSMTNCRLTRTSAGSNGTALLDNQNIFNQGAPGVHYNRVLLNGFQVVDTGGYSGTPIAGLIASGVTVGRLVLAGVDGTQIAAVNNGGTITATAGTLL